MLVVSLGLALTVALLSTLTARSMRGTVPNGAMSITWLAAHRAAEQASRD